MPKSVVTRALLAATAAALPLTATAARPFDPDQVFVESLSYGGNGCPRGSFTYGIAPDASSLTLLFGDFRLDALAAGVQREARCQVRLLVHVPTGWSVAATGVELLAHANLATGAVASQEVRLRTAGEPQTLATHTMKGPLRGDYRYVQPVAEPRWSDCKQQGDTLVTMVLASTTRITAGIGQIHGTSGDGELRQRLLLGWKPCGAAPKP